MATPEAKVILTAVNRGSRAFRSFNASLSSIATRAAVVGAAAAGALALITRNSFESVDSLAKTSDKLGVATEALAGLRLAAEQTGVATNKFDMGLQRMTRRIAEIAVLGRGEAGPALEELGIAIEDIANRSPDEQFRIIADAMGDVADQGARVALGFKLFDAEGVDLIRTLNLGREGLDAYAESARRMGLAVTRIDAAKIEQANDAINLGKKAIQGIGNTIAIEVAPLITGMIDAFTNVDSSAKTLGETFAGVIDGMVSGVGFIADAFHGWRIIIGGIGLALAKTELAMANAAQAARDFFGTTQAELDATIGRLEEQFQLQARMLGNDERAIESLREYTDLQISRLGATEDLTEQLEGQVALQSLQFKLLATSVPPSERMAELIAKWREDSEAAAMATAELRSNVGGGDVGGPVAQTPEEAAAEKAAEALRLRQQRDLQTVIEFASSKEEVERMAALRRLEILRTSLASGLIDEQRFYELSAEQALKHSDKLAEIDAARMVGQTERTQAQIEAEIMATGVATELAREATRASLATDLEIYREALSLKLVTLEEFHELSIEAAERAQDQLTKIDMRGLTERQKFEQKSAQQKASFVLGTLTSLTAGIAQHNKTAFKLNKLAAIGTAVINTAQGATKALAEYPPPVSFVMAAAVIAAGAAQISAIKSAQFGGGTTPSLSGSTPTVNNVPVGESTLPSVAPDGARSDPRIEVHIQGSVIGMSGAEELVDFIQDSLSDRIENRDEVIFTSASRQAAV